MSTEPFQLTDNSVFYLGIRYGVTDSLEASSILSNGKSVTFYIQLIDDVTNEVLGILEEIQFSESNIVRFEDLAYMINTSGLGNRTCRLRIFTNDNLNSEYSLSDQFDNVSLLPKKEMIIKSFNGEEEIKSYELSQNYPNPFNPTTSIVYQCPQNGFVTLKIFDILGKEVKTLVKELKSAGKYRVTFDASSLSSGAYIYQIRINDYVASKKMLLIK